MATVGPLSPALFGSTSLVKDISILLSIAKAIPLTLQVENRTVGVQHLPSHILHRLSRTNSLR